jgi:hypothetical protein
MVKLTNIFNLLVNLTMDNLVNFSLAKIIILLIIIITNVVTY